MFRKPFYKDIVKAINVLEDKRDAHWYTYLDCPEDARPGAEVRYQRFARAIERLRQRLARY